MTSCVYCKDWGSCFLHNQHKAEAEPTCLYSPSPCTSACCCLSGCLACPALSWLSPHTSACRCFSPCAWPPPHPLYPCLPPRASPAPPLPTHLCLPLFFQFAHLLGLLSLLFTKHALLNLSVHQCLQAIGECGRCIRLKVARSDRGCVNTHSMFDSCAQAH